MIFRTLPCLYWHRNCTYSPDHLGHDWFSPWWPWEPPPLSSIDDLSSGHAEPWDSRAHLAPLQLPPIAVGR